MFNSYVGLPDGKLITHRWPKIWPPPWTNIPKIVHDSEHKSSGWDGWTCHNVPPSCSLRPCPSCDYQPQQHVRNWHCRARSRIFGQKLKHQILRTSDARSRYHLATLHHWVVRPATEAAVEAKPSPKLTISASKATAGNLSWLVVLCLASSWMLQRSHIFSR